MLRKAFLSKLPSAFTRAAACSLKIPSSISTADIALACFLDDVLPTACFLDDVVPSACFLDDVFPTACFLEDMLLNACFLDDGVPSAWFLDDVLPSACFLDDVLPSAGSYAVLVDKAILAALWFVWVGADPRRSFAVSIGVV